MRAEVAADGECDYVPSQVTQAANTAYRARIPPLSGRPAIGPYIACVAHGVALGVFTGKESTQMMYAAQVALSLNPQPRATQPDRRNHVNKGRK